MSSPIYKTAVIIAIALVASLAPATSFQKANAFFIKGSSDAPIATSGERNVYIAWPSNKTGNNEVMFKASTDGGKTFSDKMNLSNSSKSESVDVQMAASGSNVYVSWWERNATSNEPVLRVSNDNGKTFGEKIMLSAK